MIFPLFVIKADYGELLFPPGFSRQGVHATVFKSLHHGGIRNRVTERIDEGDIGLSRDVPRIEQTAKDHAGAKDALLSYYFIMEDPVPDAIGIPILTAHSKKGVTIRKILDCPIAYAAINKAPPVIAQRRRF